VVVLSFGMNELQEIISLDVVSWEMAMTTPKMKLIPWKHHECLALLNKLKERGKIISYA